ncbi:GntR family transcriptional regulator [Neobacillus soli]|uniref:GntR family transcriptional regulator n=1 Tax=Neobacillus soli TaxID=220688 RepID=UPI000827066A|nr:GntR family transcriptional regulator [Neobacillus soli]
MAKKIIRRDTLLDQVYPYLRDQIITGGIEPGRRLVEERLAEELGVSRSPVREAIRLLGKDGLVVEQQNGGVTVYNPTLNDYQSLFECRIVLEPLAAIYAAKRRTEKQLEEMKNIFESTPEEISDNDMKRVYQMNERFHQMIVESSANPFLKKMITELRGVISFYRRSILEIEPARKTTVIKEHYAIFQAIKDQDAEAAKVNMKKHLEVDYQLYLAAKGINPEISVDLSLKH